jgi:hypothetical protein
MSVQPTLLAEETASSDAVLRLAPVPPSSPLWGVGRFRFHLRVRTRFLLTVLFGAGWAAFSTWLALGWIDGSVAS